jgi:hypothetical protein
MRIKMGTVVPKMGTTVHLAADQARYRESRLPPRCVG